MSAATPISAKAAIQDAPAPEEAEAPEMRGQHVITKPRTLGGAQDRAIIASEQDEVSYRNSSRESRVAQKEGEDGGYDEIVAPNKDMADFWATRADILKMGVAAYRVKRAAESAKRAPKA